jgi:hypothetical protein
MALTNAYVTYAEMQQHLSMDVSDTGNQSTVEPAVNAACRAIDQWCGQSFYATSVATARTFDARNGQRVWTAPFHNTTGLAIATDSAANGAYGTTWAASDYQLLPADGVDPYTGEAWPFNEIIAVGSYAFPYGTTRRGLIRVTAQWGWAVTPDPVAYAARLLAADLWKRKDAPFGIMTGTVDFGGLRIGRDLMAGVASMLSPYRVRWPIG